MSKNRVIVIKGMIALPDDVSDDDLARAEDVVGSEVAKLTEQLWFAVAQASCGQLLPMEVVIGGGKFCTIDDVEFDSTGRQE